MNNLQFYNGTTDDNYKRFDGSNTKHFLLFNDSPANSLVFSFDGQTIKGIIQPDEGIEFLDVEVSTIHIKNFTLGNDAVYRLWFTGSKEMLDDQGNKINVSQRGEVPKFFARTKAVR